MRKMSWASLSVLLSMIMLSTGCISAENDMGLMPKESPVEVEIDKKFSKRDRKAGYVENMAVNILLNKEEVSIEGDGASLDGNVITIDREGTYVISGIWQDGRIVVDAGSSDKVQLVFDNIAIACSDNAPIYIRKADKVIITLKEGSENALTDGFEYVQTDDNNVDGVIFSKEDLTINGSGTLYITGNYKHGVISKDDLVITGGNFHITAVKDALNGKDSVKIKDGIFRLSSKDGNGIQSKNEDDETKGYVYISGGEITVVDSKEGIEGAALVIDGGIIDITARDDGLNANNADIVINGGIITIDAKGDGIDSNGSVYVTGGITYVSGPEDDDNAGLDYDESAHISGGIFLVTGSSGMAQGFSDSSTQQSILYNLDSVSEAGTEISLIDEQGNVIISHIPAKQYQSILISTPDLKKDMTYTLVSGNQREQIAIFPHENP